MLTGIGATAVVAVTMRTLWRQLRSYEGKGINAHIDKFEQFGRSIKRDAARLTVQEKNTEGATESCTVRSYFKVNEIK